MRLISLLQLLPGESAMGKRPIEVAVCGILALAGAAPGALAEAPAAGPQGAELQEVIVTARKRAESLEQTPISVTAVTAEDMARLGISSMVEVAQRTPGLQYGNFGDLKLSPTSLRGITSSSGSAGADPAVGYYVDEIYEGQGVGANLDLFDTDRVEVLRGPQGTLFGRNTIGGVISITTKRPSETLDASVTADLGNYNAHRIGGSVSGPILSDTVLGKLSVVNDQRDGYEYNTYLHTRVNNHNTTSVRGQLLFKFAPKTELLLTAEYSDANQHPLAFESNGYNMQAITPQLLVAAGYPLNTNPFDHNVIENIITRETLSSGTFAATFKADLGGVNLTNIASYHQHSYFSKDDTCRCQLRIAYDGDPEKVYRASDELRFDGKAGAIDWLAGVYYYHQNTANQSFVELGSDLAAIFGDPSLTGLVTGSNGKLTTDSTAGFASLTWNASNLIDVTVGGRYTRDKKDIHYIQVDPIALLGGNADIRAADSWTQFTPNANLRVHFSPQVLGYLTASKGFKSGGYNDALGDANGISYGPETLWNYEAGLKAVLLERRLIANIAVFDMQWKQIQITTQNPLVTFYDPIILNAGAAHSRGVEVEVSARPTERWLLGFNTSVQQARYDEGTLPDGSVLKRIPFAPTYTAGVNLEYRIPAGIGDVVLFGEYLRRGGTFLSTNNDQDGYVSSYGLANLRASLESANRRWRVTAWGKNLADTVYKERLFDLYNNALVGQKFLVLGNPRTYGVEVALSVH
jgi:iron complex outermembrane receptor protein